MKIIIVALLSALVFGCSANTSANKPISKKIESGVTLTKEQLVGVWRVVGVKPEGSNSFNPPLKPAKWNFTEKNKFIEELGSGGAQIHWDYNVSGDSISTKFSSLAFKWRILSYQQNAMVVKHHLGIFKVVRI